MIIVVMNPGVAEKETAAVVSGAEKMGLECNVSYVSDTPVVTVIGDIEENAIGSFKSYKGVQNVMPIVRPWNLSGRNVCGHDTIVSVDGVKVGGSEIVIMAGPCAVENRDWLMATARAVRDAGATFLRGGAFKPRTSPYSFRGLGEQGLQLLAEAREETGLRIVTEVIAPEDVPMVAKYADVLQIGARNMQNFALLEAAGDSGHPVLLKRGMMSSLEELLISADYVLSRGNPNVILCERGIRSFEKYTRNTLDISAVPVIKKLSHLPIIVDPSHSVGRHEYVAPVSRAAIAAGADGILVEVHVSPDKAYCDGQQSLTIEDFTEMMSQLKAVAGAIGRKIGSLPNRRNKKKHKA